MKNKPYPYYHDIELYTLKEFLSYCAEKYPDNTAFSFPSGKSDLHKTYSRFSDDVSAVGSYFIENFKKGTSVAVFGENSYEWLVLYFSAANSGNIVIPLDISLSVEKVAEIISQTGAGIIFFSDQYKDYAEKLEACTENVRIRLISEVRSSIIPGYAGKKDAMNGVQIAPDDVCSVIFTSGTTGKNKGVMLTHKSLTVDVINARKHVLYPSETLLSLPLYHAFGIHASVFCPMLTGTEIYISRSLKMFVSDIIKKKPGMLVCVPVMVEGLYKKINEEISVHYGVSRFEKMRKTSRVLLSLGIDARRKIFKKIIDSLGGNISFIISGGAPLEREKESLFEDIGIHILSGYGVTECSPLIAVNRNDHFKPGSVGKPIPCAEVIIDSPDGAPEGEILVSGDMLMKGYFSEPELTAEAMHGKYFRTGDIGYLDGDGFLFITGRKKNMIVLSNGKNVYPEELEAEWLGQGAVREIVISEENGMLTAEIFPDKAFLSGQGISDAGKYFDGMLEKFNKEHPAYKNIGKIILRENEFPKTASMKIIRSGKK